MIRRPPRSTRTDTLFPYTTLFRSHAALRIGAEQAFRGAIHHVIGAVRAQRTVPFGAGQEIDAVRLDQAIALITDMVAVGIDQLAHRSLEAAPCGVELADIAATPQEIEAVIVLKGEAVDPFAEKTLGDRKSTRLNSSH